MLSRPLSCILSYLDSLGAREPGGELEVDDVPGVVLDDDEHSRLLRDVLDCGLHLLVARTSEDASADGSLDDLLVHKAVRVKEMRIKI